ncbi:MULTISPECIES: PLDc N-terminal domain-containing protein [Actinosynnema]|uniref:PLDc N-terminal domain-containing protein n=1 Tax=Actinosynnema TaxID=40566 RepID=UPI0020A2F372|nr:PLDc N-terminal domain-containing protein [Actinosynnema pretiosum]MCP2099270.1 Phospholipase_D-nuclease N-terminal [Actinosynnema pretiosum]
MSTTAQTATTIAQQAQQDPDFQIWGIALGSGMLVVLAALVVFFLAALVSILGSPQGFLLKLVWIAIVLCLPFLGCLLWFAIGRGFARREAADRRREHGYR